MIGSNNANLWNNSFNYQNNFNFFGNYGQNYNNSFNLNNSFMNLMSLVTGKNNSLFQQPVQPPATNAVNANPSANLFDSLFAPNSYVDQTEVTVESKEPENVFVIGKNGNGKSSESGKLTLEDIIKDFAGERRTSGWGHKKNKRTIYHNKFGGNDSALSNLLNNLSKEDKQRLLTRGESFLISESGKIIGTIASDQVVAESSFKHRKPTYTPDGSFQIISDLGIDQTAKFKEKGGPINQEEGMGGTIGFNGQEYNVISTAIRKGTPLILDLKGDGIELTSVKDGVNFDLNADGKTDKTAWTKSKDDVFLVYDKDSNGQIDSGKELFGDQNGAENGFLELTKYDNNKDGKVDAKDDVYKDLQTWSDANHNGKVDDGELKSLIESNVKSVSTGFNKELDETGKLKEDQHGNTIGLTGQFERSDGTKGNMIDVLLQYIG